MVLLLTWHQAEQEKRKAIASDWRDEGWIIDRGDGHWLHPDTLRSYFRCDCAIAGVPPFKLHALRHSAGSMLAAAGVNLKAIADLLGHASISPAMDVNAYLPTQSLREATTTHEALLGLPKNATTSPSETAY